MVAKEFMFDHVLEELLENIPRLVKVRADALKEKLKVITGLEVGRMLNVVAEAAIYLCC